MASAAAHGKYLEYLQEQYQALSSECPLAADVEKSSKSRRGDNIQARGRSSGTYLKLPPEIPVLDNTITPCSKYYVVDQGDTCPSISQKFGVSISDLKAWNKGINKYCTTLWKGYAICLSPGNDAGESPKTKSSSRNTSKREETAAQNQPGPMTKQSEVAVEVPCECHQGEDKDSCYARCQEVLGVSAAKMKKAAPPTPGLIPSPNGKCGGRVVCAGTKFGDCCSTSGYCGTGAQYCGKCSCLDLQQLWFTLKLILFDSI